MALIGFGLLLLIGLGIWIWKYPVILLILILVILLSTFLWLALDKMDYFTGKKQGWFKNVVIKAINPFRKLFKKRPIWLIPESLRIGDTRGEEIITQANYLVYEVQDALIHNPISPEKKISFTQMSQQVPENITQALWKLSRMDRFMRSVSSISDPMQTRRQEVDKMKSQLFNEIKHSLEILSEIPVSLLGVELDHTNLETDRLLEELISSNNRLRELSTVYKEANAGGDN